MTERRFVKMVCATCGSEEVQADAYASWNFSTQEWELDTTFDKGAVCNGKCDGETRLEEVELTGEDLRLALIHAAAIDDGWLPSDEDSAEEYCKGYGLLDDEGNLKEQP